MGESPARTRVPPGRTGGEGGFLGGGEADGFDDEVRPAAVGGEGA